MSKKFNSLTKVVEFRFKLYPRDFDKMKKFYEETLGYPVSYEWDFGVDDRGVMFDTGGATLELLTPKKGYKKVQGADLSLKVEDVWALWEKFKQYPTLTQELKTASWGDTGFKIADPEGMQITFFTSRRRP